MGACRGSRAASEGSGLCVLLSVLPAYSSGTAAALTCTRETIRPWAFEFRGSTSEAMGA